MFELRDRHFHFKTNTLKVGLAILHCGFIIFCVYTLQRKWQVAPVKLFWGAFLFRLAAGISVGLVYTYYYSTNDTWLFFEDAKKFASVASEDFFYFLKALFDFDDAQNLPGLASHDQRSVFFIKIISIFCLLTRNNYWACTAYFSLFAFIISWRLHQKITQYLPESTFASALAFLFFPSVIFWSSGLEKESLALAGIYFLAIVFLSLMEDQKPPAYSWVLALPMSFVVWSLKYYWAVIFLMATLTALLLRFLSFRYSWIRNHAMPVWVALFFGIGLVLSFAHPNFYLEALREVIVSNYHAFAALSDPFNLIHYVYFEPTWTSLFLNSPWALFSGLFRPLLGEGHGLLGMAASIENFFLLVLFLGSLGNLIKAFRSPQQVSLLAAVSYCVVLCVFLALSTPNLGTLSRYRVGFLPFFVFMIAYRNPMLKWIANKIA